MERCQLKDHKHLKIKYPNHYARSECKKTLGTVKKCEK